MGFMRGRTDIKGQCGCAWSHIEPGVDEAREAVVYDTVRSLVIDHARTLGHNPTIVVIREAFYSLDTPDDDGARELEEAFAEPG